MKKDSSKSVDKYSNQNQKNKQFKSQITLNNCNIKEDIRNNLNKQFDQNLEFSFGVNKSHIITHQLDDPKICNNEKNISNFNNNKLNIYGQFCGHNSNINNIDNKNNKMFANTNMDNRTNNHISIKSNKDLRRKSHDIFVNNNKNKVDKDYINLKDVNITSKNNNYSNSNIICNNEKESINITNKGILNKQLSNISNKSRDISPCNSNYSKDNNKNINSNPDNNDKCKSIKDQIELEKDLMKTLYKANEYYKSAYTYSSQYLYTDALNSFYEARRLTQSVYNVLKHNKKTKEQMDYFLKAIESQLKNNEDKKKAQFNYPSSINNTLNNNQNELSEELKKVFSKKPNIEYNKNSGLNQITIDKSELVDRSNANVVKQSKIQEKINNNCNNTNVKLNQNSNNISNNQRVVPDDLREKILSEVLNSKPNVKFNDVIGLKYAKQSIKEMIILPSLRPDLFTGLRSPPRGLLLFGPPGTGKTMLAKAVATECSCTFFSISASSLTSKYVGESEKLVRALFDIAYEKQPSVVFIDEIDSILSKRGDSNENEASKRLKTEFLVQFDGVGSLDNVKVLIIGATNRPMELDNAVIRRLPKRIYVGAFDKEERYLFLKFIMKNEENNLSDNDLISIADKTDNYSNSDLKELCREAAYGPARDVDFNDFSKINKFRPIDYKDFVNALKKVRGILNDKMLKELDDWDKNYGATI